MNNIDMLPKFKYHPNLYQNNEVVFEKGICQCCEKEVTAYIESMYCAADVDCICLDCVASGRAAEKFNGDFIQDTEQLVSDDKKTEELFRRTPGYISWQGEYWLVCCDDYCAYLGTVGTKELEEMGIADQVFTEYESKNKYGSNREYLTKDGVFCGYLFQCLHCGKYHLWEDMN